MQNKRCLRYVLMLIFGVLVTCLPLTGARPEARQPLAVVSPSIAEPTTHNKMSQVKLTPVQAAILGLVEGVTEYLPISSTGHLFLTQRLMGLGKTADEQAAANAYAICIQAGAILAVISLYGRRLRRMVLGLFGRDDVGRRLVVNLTLAFLPAAFIGILYGGMIKQYLFGTWPIVVAWFVGGIVILGIAYRQRTHALSTDNTLEHMTSSQALIIGCLQSLAMWPGVSRSLMTIVGGALVGLSIPAAVEFSFLLGLVTLGAATLYEALTSGQMIITTFGWVNPVIGLCVAWGAAMLSVKWMVGYLNRQGLEIFGYYRIALALVVAVSILAGLLTEDAL